MHITIRNALVFQKLIHFNNIIDFCDNLAYDKYLEMLEPEVEIMERGDKWISKCEIMERTRCSRLFSSIPCGLVFLIFFYLGLIRLF
jgi:hypothetical protein